jgi:hypothetical protein
MSEFLSGSIRIMSENQRLSALNRRHQRAFSPSLPIEFAPAHKWLEKIRG